MIVEELRYWRATLNFTPGEMVVAVSRSEAKRVAMKRAQILRAVNRLRERRRAANQCVRDQRDRHPTAPAHATPRAGRELCDACHERQMELQRKRRDAKRKRLAAVDHVLRTLGVGGGR